MGCAISLPKSYDNNKNDTDTLVSVCRQRKKYIKSAVERRYTLATAHSKYNQSLYAVSLALRLFISRHSPSSTSPFLLTYDDGVMTSPYPTVESKPIKKKETTGDDDIVCNHFYDDVTPTEKVTSSGEGECHEFDGWDYFSPLVVKDKDKVGDDANVSQEVQSAVGGGARVKGCDANVSQDSSNGKELLEALKDVENHFLKSYECGLEFSKLLEFNNEVGPSLDHIDPKECSERLIPSIAWHKSTLTRSPSCRSLLSSSSRNSFSWSGINSNSDIFDETGGMESGSHLSTLGRLHAWEKKLYDEVKAGYELMKIYDRKSSQLSNENGSNNKSGIEEEVNDLYSRVLVSMKIRDSISKRIEKVRDDELLPQLIELLRGLTKTWKVMCESHKLQSQTMFEVKKFTCADLINDGSRHLATLQLEAEIQNWQTCFSSYIASTEAYIEAVSEWAYRTIGPEHELDTPPVFTMCHNWLTVIKNLPDKAVTYAMKRFAKDLRTLWSHQEMEQQQKRKVDRLVAESGRKLVSFEREERNIINSRPLNVRNKVDVLTEKKAQLDTFRNMVEIEKAKHKDCVEETRRVILVGFQTGFASVFDSLAEFSNVCVRKYGYVAQNTTLRPNLIHGQ